MRLGIGTLVDQVFVTRDLEIQEHLGILVDQVFAKVDLVDLLLVIPASLAVLILPKVGLVDLHLVILETLVDPSFPKVDLAVRLLAIPETLVRRYNLVVLAVLLHRKVDLVDPNHLGGHNIPESLGDQYPLVVLGVQILPVDLVVQRSLVIRVDHRFLRVRE